MKAVDLYGILFSAMLGRELSANERIGVQDRYGDEDIDPASVANEIVKSQEFFLRHRGDFVKNLFPKATVVTARGPLGHQIHCDLRQLHLGLSMASGHYEPAEGAFIQRNVKRGMTVLDVGANIGYFTTMCAGLVGDSGKVIALEPVNDTFHKLRSAVRLNNQEHIVELHNIAASTEDGTVELSYEVDSVNMGGVSMRPTGTKAAHQISQTANAQRIDDVVWGRPIHFVKMDIEGAEGFALEGATKTLTESRPVVIMEFNEIQLKNVSNIGAEDLFRKVLQLGYSGHRLLDGGETSPISAEEISAMSSEVINVSFFPS